MCVTRDSHSSWRLVANPYPPGASCSTNTQLAQHLGFTANELGTSDCRDPRRDEVPHLPLRCPPPSPLHHLGLLMRPITSPPPRPTTVKTMAGVIWTQLPPLLRVKNTPRVKRRLVFLPHSHCHSSSWGRVCTSLQKLRNKRCLHYWSASFSCLLNG